MCLGEEVVTQMQNEITVVREVFCRAPVLRIAAAMILWIAVARGIRDKYMCREKKGDREVWEQQI